uniref:Uncharacterized protein n=1 Tax=Anguilla anguilla TaxID=7936 RepID=A0A0E9PFM8_ANGAN
MLLLVDIAKCPMRIIDCGTEVFLVM